MLLVYNPESGKHPDSGAMQLLAVESFLEPLSPNQRISLAAGK